MPARRSLAASSGADGATTSTSTPSPARAVASPSRKCPVMSCSERGKAWATKTARVGRVMARCSYEAAAQASSRACAGQAAGRARAGGRACAGQAVAPGGSGSYLGQRMAALSPDEFHLEPAVAMLERLLEEPPVSRAEAPGAAP